MQDTNIEESCTLNLDFSKLQKAANCGEAIPAAIAQDVDTGEVLIVGYANQLALTTALREGMATFWSTSRNELWTKGKTSGDYLEIVETLVNCEQNSILYRVRPKGKGACHTHNRAGVARTGCYYRRIVSLEGGQLEFVEGKQ